MEAVLVLNADYTPINTTTLTRGFVLVHKGKAEILKGGEKPIATSIGNFIRPLIIRLLHYVSFRPVKSRISRHKIYKRDNHECVYCGSKKNLTVDHILPKSRGGSNTWTNLITCCSNCNRQKGDKTPDEANMKLRFKPYEPSIFSEIINSNVEHIWNDFKKSFS